jgi:DNA-binding transcriptional MerR regulator
VQFEFMGKQIKNKIVENEYHKRLGVLTSMIERTLAPLEVKKITGLSRRQLSEWDSKGLLPTQKRDSQNAWRRFSGANTIQLAILSELRKTGLSPIDLRELAIWMRDREVEMMKYIREKTSRGSLVFLSSNLKERFFLHSDTHEDIQEMIVLAYQRGGDSKIVLQININNIVNGILKELNEKPLK